MLYKYLLLFSLFNVSQSTFVMAEETKKQNETSNIVKVFNPIDGEEDILKLRSGQSANIKVFLGSLGEMLNKNMITLLNMDTNELVASQLTGDDGIVVFRKISAGNYSVYVNKRVLEEGEVSTVKVADVVLQSYP